MIFQVKDHMRYVISLWVSLVHHSISYPSTKLDLFTSLGTHLDKHTVILNERKEMLINHKERLVREGGTLLGFTQNESS
jgi:hypothetical protein